jgi:DinB family protein
LKLSAWGGRLVGKGSLLIAAAPAKEAEMLASPLYEDLVGLEDPLTLLASTPDRIANLVRGWDAHRWSQTYAPGKWTAAQVVLHLAQDELCWGNRVRFALSVEDYVVQPFDGAEWVALEAPVDPERALAAYLALRRLNLPLYSRIPADLRARPFRHPEFGEISIDWIFRTLAGHDRHHLGQLQAIAGL